MLNVITRQKPSQIFQIQTSKQHYKNQKAQIQLPNYQDEIAFHTSPVFSGMELSNLKN